MPVADGQLEDVGRDDRRQVAQPGASGTQKLPDQFIVQWRGLLLRATKSVFQCRSARVQPTRSQNPPTRKPLATSVV